MFRLVADITELNIDQVKLPKIPGLGMLMKLPNKQKISMIVSVLNAQKGQFLPKWQEAVNQKWGQLQLLDYQVEQPGDGSCLARIRIDVGNAAAKGFINATDCADYLVGKGLPFRDAYKATGELVALCIDKGLTLETLPIEEYKNVCDIFDEGVYEAINLEKCVNDRLVEGGPSVSSIENQIKKAREIIEK